MPLTSLRITLSPRFRNRVRLAPVVGIFAVALLSGCGSDTPDAPAGPTQTATSDAVTADSEPTATTPTPKEKPKKPTRPPEMGGTDALAAIHTAEYFLDLYNYSIKTGDAYDFQRLCLDKSHFCSDTADRLRTQAADGITQWGGELTWQTPKISRNYKDLDVIPMQFQTVESHIQLVDSDGEVVEETPSAQFLLEIYLAHVGNGWRILRVQGEES